MTKTPADRILGWFEAARSAWKTLAERRPLATDLLVAFLIVLTGVGVGFGTGFTNVQHFGAGAHIGAHPTAGPNIELTTDTELESGNWAPNQTAVVLRSNQGNGTFISNGYSQADVDPAEISGTYTNVSTLDVDQANLTVAPPDKRKAAVGGQADSFAFRDVVVNDSQTDFVYSASGESTVIVGNGSSGVQYGAMDQATNQGLDAAVADANGEIAFTELSSGSHTVSVEPLGSLFIRNESNPSELVDNTSVTLEFYFEGSDPLIVTRPADNGSIDMTGLPADQPFVVSASADGYVSRRIYVPSLLQTQSIYLLPDSEPYVEQIFELRDYSGDFPEEDTVLLIQRGLNGSWQTVEGDYFGATGEFSARLKDEARFQLILINTETGVRKDVGDHVPIADGSKVVQVTTGGQVELIEAAPKVTFDPAIRSLPATNSTDLATEIAPGDADLISYNVTWILHNESGQYTLATENGTDASGERWEKTFDLGGSAGGNLTVVTDWTTSAGTAGTETDVFVITEYFANKWSLLNIVASIPDVLPGQTAGMFTTFLAIVISLFVMLFVGGNLRASTEAVAGAGVASLSFFGAVGFISWGIVFVAGFTAVVFGAVRRGL